MNGTYTQAHAINDHGRIVGDAHGEWPDACDFRPVAVQWLHAYAPIERVFCPNSLDSPTHANDVNNSGLIVGWHNQQQINYGWTWNGLFDQVPMNFGISCQHWAYGTNEAGEVVGTAEACAPPNHRRAFIWDGTSPTMTSLGTLNNGTTSTAREINDQRFVVGSANTLVRTGPTSTSLLNRAFIWHANFGMQALPLPKGLDPKDTQCGANAVSRRNEDGLIRVVGSCSSDGVNHAIRWEVMTSKHLWIPQL
jgi:probable HAF family extracellular repeat protein